MSTTGYDEFMEIMSNITDYGMIVNSMDLTTTRRMCSKAHATSVVVMICYAFLGDVLVQNGYSLVYDPLDLTYNYVSSEHNLLRGTNCKIGTMIRMYNSLRLPQL